MDAYLHKVQYYETDKMGVVHHSNYIRWFEEARVDYMEKMGKSYDSVEKDGIISPVVSVNCEYKASCGFGDSVYVLTKLQSLTGVRFSFSYTVVDSITKEVKAKGESHHCFVKDNRVISLKKVNVEVFNLFESFVDKETVIPD